MSILPLFLLLAIPLVFACWPLIIAMTKKDDRAKRGRARKIGRYYVYGMILLAVLGWMVHGPKLGNVTGELICYSVFFVGSLLVGFLALDPKDTLDSMP